VKLFTLPRVSPRYALRAALYRRVARGQGVTGLDFSEAALRQLYDFESRGIGSVDKARNGYAYGKWCVDLSVSMWVEDIQAGNACKAEFLQTAIQRIHNADKLKNMIAGEFFPWRQEIADYKVAP